MRETVVCPWCNSVRDIPDSDDISDADEAWLAFHIVRKGCMN